MIKLNINDINYNEGIRKDNNNHYIFDKETDKVTDFLYLNPSINGVKTEDGLTYYFAYKFNDDKKVNRKELSKFRTALKKSFEDTEHFYDIDVYEFVQDGIYHLDEMKSLDTFNVVITTAKYYGEHTLAGKMAMLIWDEVPDTTPCGNIQLIKKMTQEVTFDENRAGEALAKINKYSTEYDREQAIEELKNQFEIAMKKDEIFTMKHYQPVHGRAGFIDFLKFPTPKHQAFYEALKNGTEVLICDDFMTSGSTIKEIIRFLNSINANTNISVFVLIDQYRKY